MWMRLAVWPSRTNFDVHPSRISIPPQFAQVHVRSVVPVPQEQKTGRDGSRPDSMGSDSELMKDRFKE